MKQDKILSSLSICKKAGMLACGEFQVDEAVKSGRGYLVIIAEDASPRTKKDVSDMCSYYEVPIYEHSTKEALGAAVGKEYLSQVCIKDKSFSDSISKKLEVSNGKNENQ